MSTDGSVFQVTKRGRQYLAAELDLPSQDGKRRRTRRLIPLPDTTGLGARAAKRAIEEAHELARQKLEELRRLRDGGVPIEFERITVGAYLDIWLRDVVAVRREVTTHATYSDLVRLHIKPAIGSVPLRALRPSHVRRMLSDMAAAGLSHSMQRQARSVLHAALNQAMEDGDLALNAATPVKIRKKTGTSRPTLTADQARALLDGVAGDRLEAMFVLAVGTGIRKGEIRGLQWSDVDLERRQIWVHQQLRRQPVGEYPPEHPKAGKTIWGDVFAGLKGGAPPRMIAISELVAGVLQRHRDRQSFERTRAGDAWATRTVEGQDVDWDLVFCTELGAPLGERTINSWFQAKLALLDGVEMHWHDLRHTFATLLAPHHMPAEVRDALGHASIQMTDHYTERAAPEALKAIADTMDELLTGTEDDATAVAH